MSIYSVPKGGLNKGIIIPLKFKCPNDCVCGSIELRTWHHRKCGDPSFITEFGDIICRNHLQGCQGIFIQNARFQCNIAKKCSVYYQYKSAPALFMALSQALSAAELNCQASNDLNRFCLNILKSLTERWNN